MAVYTHVRVLPPPPGDGVTHPYPGTAVTYATADVLTVLADTVALLAAVLASPEAGALTPATCRELAQAVCHGNAIITKLERG